MPNLKDTFLAGIIKENPVFVLLLALCPVLGVSSSFVNAVGMGVITGVVVLFSNIIVSILRKIIPNEVRIPVLISIIATIVTVMEMLVQAYMPGLHSALGIFLPLIVANCAVFGRAEAIAMKNGLVVSVLDALGVGIGFVLALGLMGFVRELLGTGAVNMFGVNLPVFPAEFAISIFVAPAGSFIVLGLLIGLFTTIKLAKASSLKVANA